MLVLGRFEGQIIRVGTTVTVTVGSVRSGKAFLRIEIDGRYFGSEFEVGQQLFVGEHIVLVITKMRGGQVWIGTQAPIELLIIRGELDEEDQQQSPALV
jgi:sRNA-binding carbon storage regulator CsrA